MDAHSAFLSVLDFAGFSKCCFVVSWSHSERPWQYRYLRTQGNVWTNRLGSKTEEHHQPGSWEDPSTSGSLGFSLILLALSVVLSMVLLASAWMGLCGKLTICRPGCQLWCLNSSHLSPQVPEMSEIWVNCTCRGPWLMVPRGQSWWEEQPEKKNVLDGKAEPNLSFLFPVVERLPSQSVASKPPLPGALMRRCS